MSIEHNGSEYSLTGTDGLDLAQVFQRSIVEATMPGQNHFIPNVVAYHNNERFRAFVNENSGEQGQMMLVAFSGLKGMQDFMKSARSHKVAGAARGTVKTERGWDSLCAERLFSVGYQAMEDHYRAHRDEIWAECKVPADSRKESLADFVSSTGKSSWSKTVVTYSGVSPVSGEQSDKWNLALTFRIDMNNAARALKYKKSQEESNGQSQEATA